MFSSIRNFFDRHRRKFLITGAVLGSAYVIGRFTQWKLNEWYENQQAEFLVQSKKQLHFDGNQKTCNTTFNSLLPGLQEILSELLDTESITETLKSNPSDKVQLWEQLKILSFSRTVAAVYSSSLLLVFLRVQLNLLGGYMYLDIDENCDGGEEAVSKENGRVYVSDANQKRYLAIVRYFLEVGVKKLVNIIKEVVEGVLGSISLKQKLSYHDIKRMLGQIRQCLKFSNSGTSRFKISSFILPSEDSDENSDKDDVFEKLLNETADVLESDDFQLVLNSCLDVGFMYVMEKMKQLFIVDQQDVQPDMICSIEDGCCSIHLPLARIIPVMTGKINDVFAENKNDYLQDIISLESAKSFSANIYEAFSNKPREPQEPLV